MEGQNTCDQITIMIECPNGRDQIVSSAFHSFLVEVQINAGYIMCCAYVRPSPFFFCLASNAFPDIGLVSRIKKKNKKKTHKKSWNRRPCYPGTMLKVNFHIIGLTKCTIC